jgi:hypothetical protein
MIERFFSEEKVDDADKAVLVVFCGDGNGGAFWRIDFG